MNLLNLAENERISAIYLFVIFRRPLFILGHRSRNGEKKCRFLNLLVHEAKVIAVSLDEGDSLIGAAITNGSDHVMLFTIMVK